MSSIVLAFNLLIDSMMKRHTAVNECDAYHIYAGMCVNGDAILSFLQRFVQTLIPALLFLYLVYM